LNNWNSRKLTRGNRQGIKAFYYGLGWDEKDFDKPLIGIGTPLHEINLCNLHSYEIGAAVKAGLDSVSMFGFRIGVPSVSDNITQGHEGGCASLASRNVIASSTEMVATSHCFDGFIGLHHCDKNGPGFAMALVRTNLPGFVLSGGTIRPGCLDGKELTIQDVYDVQAANEIGEATTAEMEAVIRHACPGPGGCGIAASFNTWGLAMEAMGLMPPHSSSNPAEGKEKTEECLQAGKWMAEILSNNLRPRDIVTRQSLANATAMIGAAGGSTNGILHILALALESDVDFNLKDVQKILRKTPVYCNFAPRGKGTMIDLFKLGGTPMLIKHLVKAGVLDGSAPTLFARDLAAQVAEAGDVPAGQDLIAPVGAPFKDFSDVQVCFGNLAPDGIVFKVSSRQESGFEGEAICFSDADALVAAVNEGRVRPGHVVILRGMGPVAMGMPEVLLATSALSTAELDGKVALISDARISGVSHGAIGIHCSPEAAVGGAIARVADGDLISFDLLTGEVSWESLGPGPDDEEHVFPAFEGREIYLREFSQNTTQAHQGCVSKQVLSV